jgi:hypothetical protein
MVNIEERLRNLPTRIHVSGGQTIATCGGQTAFLNLAWLPTNYMWHRNMTRFRDE